MDEIKNHAYDFIRKRLAPDGHQTPYKGYSVFIAEHATATCCTTYENIVNYKKNGKERGDLTSVAYVLVYIEKKKGLNY